MFDLGTQELILIFIVAFLVFGPKKLPELGRALGKGMRELKAAMRGVKESFEEAGAADAAEEIKKTKASLEESIYKSIESNLGRIEEEEKTGETGGDELDRKNSEGDQEKGKKDKETDRDG
ncbi:MAG: twin-arginine translocase TatA/TatE family subunit [Deferribacteres bacterium]|nr:twin-arginine translocase TatA/TatE family subunit [Deferribacteres bacterium]